MRCASCLVAVGLLILAGCQSERPSIPKDVWPVSSVDADDYQIVAAEIRVKDKLYLLAKWDGQVVFLGQRPSDVKRQNPDGSWSLVTD